MRMAMSPRSIFRPSLARRFTIAFAARRVVTWVILSAWNFLCVLSQEALPDEGVTPVQVRCTAAAAQSSLKARFHAYHVFMAEMTVVMGVNTEPIERATERTWVEWLAFMEMIDAARLSHAQIARRVQAELERMEPKVGNPAWWAQGITVAYEQHSGRRMPGQQADGSFELSVSKTVNVAMHEAMATWTQFVAHDEEVRLVTASEPKTSGTDKRLTWRAKSADGSALVFTSERLANGKTGIIMRQMKLPSYDANSAAKARWAAVLTRFIDTF